MNRIPVIIPAYEPDERLINLLLSLEQNRVKRVVLVNDGSGYEYNDVFSRAKSILDRIDGVLLWHKSNLGKGKALKTAFEYILRNFSDAVGVITADSDGQHSVKCIKAVQNVLFQNPDSFVLGVRKFDGDDIPWKSKLGNKITEKVFKYLSGTAVSDTQTGLRGISRKFMSELLNVKSNRFEFEMEMLIQSIGRYNLIQVPIETIYDSVDNHKTHFNPFKDSLKIYMILVKKFISYIFSSFSCSILDLMLFHILCVFFKEVSSVWYIFLSTIVARVGSAALNFTINYKLVFNSNERVGVAVIKYLLLAVIQMLASALFITSIVKVCFVSNETLVKVVVDAMLFVASYYVQNKYVFQRK